MDLAGEYTHGQTQGRRHRMPTYRYNRYRPPVTRVGRDELADHKFAYNHRRDLEIPGPNASRYTAECTCGWRETPERWAHTRPKARVGWEKHMVLVRKQMRLVYEA